jgi:hypothetical protein
MAYNKSIKLLIGKKAYGTWFGLRNHSKGMYTGGHERYLYGIKNIINIEIQESWGIYADKN